MKKNNAISRVILFSFLYFFALPVHSQDDPPPKPTGLKATAGDGQVTLSWDLPASTASIDSWEYGFKLAGGASYSWDAIPGSSSSTTSYTVTGLTNGSTYRFKIRAKNAVGVGPLSNKASATPMGAPEVVANLSATAGDSQVTLSWDLPASTASIDSWEYGFKLAGGASYSWDAIPGSSSSTTSYIVRGLTNGSTYRFKIRAKNAVGVGPLSNKASATPMGAPEVVANLSATAGDSQVTLSWDLPASTASIDSWEYGFKLAGGASYSWDAIPGSSSSTTSYTVTGLTNGSTYRFKIRAKNAVGVGPLSNKASATPATVPDVVSSLSATPGDSEVVLVWTAPADDGGSSITGYEYQYSPGGSGWTAVSDATVTVSGLTNGTQYTFEVRAVNGVGEGTASSASATPATVPDVVSSLSATPGDSEVVLAWTAPADDGGSSITGYEYQYSPGGSGWTAVSDATVTVSGLTNGTQYTFEVRAVNGVGEGTASSASATPATVPDAVASLSATAGNGQVVLSWATPLSDGGAAITYYQYLRSGGSWTTVLGGAAARSQTVSGLNNGTTYTFSVRAVNGVGAGPAVSRSATPVEPEPVCIPSLSLSATPGNRGVILRWSADSCDEIIDHYTYSYSRGSFTTKGTSKVIYDLNNCESESFTVSAINAGGSIIATDSESATPEGSLNPPTLWLSPHGTQWVVASWSTPRDNTCKDRTLVGYSLGSWSGTANNTTIGGLAHCESHSFTVTATYSDGETVSASRSVVLEHPGTVSLTPQTPLQGFPLVATLTDPDGGISGKSWTFDSEEPNSHNVYIPPEVGKTVSVSVSYSDACGSGKSASAESNPVEGLSAKPVGLQAMPNSLAAVAAPNPFNPTTTIHVQLPASSPASLIIYNITGQVVRTLLDGHLLEAGYYTVDWDGRNRQGHPVTSGVYLYQLRTSKQVLMNKMVLIR